MNHVCEEPMTSIALSKLEANQRVFSCRPEANKSLEENPATRRQLRKSDLDALLELGVYHYPLESHTPDVHNHGANTIRALADMFTCKMTNLPLTVGLFNESNKEDHLSDLASELHSINSLMDPTPINFSPLLFLFPLFVSINVGYFIGMCSTWQVGLSVGHVVMFVHILFLVVIITGSRIFQKDFAIRLSHKVAEFLLWLRLVLKICFCYPNQKLNNKSPVKTIVVYHRLFPSSTPNVALFSILDKMWTGLIRLHGEIPIRLQRASSPPREPQHQYKRICCVPVFLVVIFFWIAFIVDTAILRENSGEVKKILAHALIMIIFVIMSSIMFLTILGSLAPLYRLIRGVCMSPLKPLRTALADFLKDESTNGGASGASGSATGVREELGQLMSKIKQEFPTNRCGKINEGVQLGNSTSLKNIAITAEEERARRADIRIKEEFGKICKLSLTFDSFLGQQQTRFIMCVDASETTQREVLAKLIYQIHSLVLTETNAPVAFVLEGDFKVLLGEVAASTIFHPPNTHPVPVSDQLARVVSKTLNDNLHLVRTSIHLPIYLDTPVYPEVEHCGALSSELQSPQTRLNSIITSPNGYSQTSPNSVSPYQGVAECPGKASSFQRTTGTTYTPRSLFVNRSNVPTISKSPQQLFQKGSHPRSNSTVSQAVECSRGIVGLFIQEANELADWNKKSIKPLVAAMTFTSRLIRLCNLEVPMEEVVFWLSLVHYWPYHMAWLILCLEQYKLTNQHTTTLSDRLVNLQVCLQQVKHRIVETLDSLEPLMTDDRSLERLESYINSKSALSLLTLKKLASCILTHNPYLRQCIQVLAPAVTQSVYPEESMKCGFPLGPLVEAQTFGVPADGSLPGLVTTNPFSPMDRNSSNKSTPIFMRGKINSTDSGENIFVNPMWEQKCPMDSGSAQPGLNSTKPLCQFTVLDVCNLLTSIPNLPLDRLRRYQNSARQHHISGAALVTGDLEKVRRELAMKYEDWQTFSVLLARLRSRVISYPNSNIIKNNTLEAIPNSLIVRNKFHEQSVHQLPEFTCVTGAASPPYNTVNTRLSTSQKSLVRQTPWLLSPQVPTGTGNSENLVHPLTESLFTRKPSIENGENQTSLSGMEEPESLWKPTGVAGSYADPVESGIIVNPVAHSEHFQTHSSEKNAPFSSDRPYYGVAQEKYKPVHSVPKTSMSNSRSSAGHHVCRNSSDYFHSKGVGNNQFNSRSTVDLRTVLGPLSSEVDMRALQHLHTRRGRRKIRPRRHKEGSNTHCFVSKPDMFMENRNYSGLPSMEQTFTLVENTAHNPFPDHSPLSPDASVKASLRSESETMMDETSDLRRLRKRPCRRTNHLNGNGHLPYRLPVIDSESDKRQRNLTTPDNLQQIKSSGNSKPKGKMEKHRTPKVFHPPALTSAQLASLKSYVEMSQRMNLLLHRSDDPTSYTNMIPYNETLATIPFWASYFQAPPPPAHSVYSAEYVDSCRPKLTKRARTAMDPLPSSSHSLSRQANQNFLPTGPFLDSETEECTCDYWYGIDQTDEKVAISEPTLHEDYCDVSSMDESPDEVQTLSYSLGKSNADSFDWEDCEVKRICSQR